MSTTIVEFRFSSTNRTKDGSDSIGSDQESHLVFVELHREWAPACYDRFLDMLRVGFMNDQYCYRCIPNFVINFTVGPSIGTQKKDADMAKYYENLEWLKVRETEKKNGAKIKSNLPGTIVFGQEEDGSTKTEIFFNIVDNGKMLDHLGFIPFGRIISKRGTTSPTGSSSAGGSRSRAGGKTKKKDSEPIAGDDAALEALVNYMNFQYGDVFFSGGVSKEKAMTRQNVLIAGGNSYIEKVYPGMTKILEVKVVS